MVKQSLYDPGQTLSVPDSRLLNDVLLGAGFFLRNYQVLS